jgi:hypothetical protein
VIEPHLNSAHLDSPRRESYRRARQVLMDARGLNTVRLETEPSRHVLPGDTLADGPMRSAAAPVPFVLAEHDRIHRLRVGMNTVGRLPDNDVVVSDLHVSRRHCAILVHTSHQCELHDTASKNGTYINGQLVTSPTRLKPGDEIRMCDLRLMFLHAANSAGPDSQERPGTV